MRLPSPQGTSSTTTALAAAAIDAPHGVQQEDQKSPERNELETPLGELIVSGRGLMAARADGRRTLARPHGDLNALVVGTEAGLLVNESPESGGSGLES